MDYFAVATFCAICIKHLLVVVLQFFQEVLQLRFTKVIKMAVIFGKENFQKESKLEQYSKVPNKHVDQISV